jgi:hypothetical protein
MKQPLYKITQYLDWTLLAAYNAIAEEESKLPLLNRKLKAVQITVDLTNQNVRTSYDHEPLPNPTKRKRTKRVH